MGIFVCIGMKSSPRAEVAALFAEAGSLLLPRLFRRMKKTAKTPEKFCRIRSRHHVKAWPLKPARNASEGGSTKKRAQEKLRISRRFRTLRRADNARSRARDFSEAMSLEVCANALVAYLPNAFDRKKPPAFWI